MYRQHLVIFCNDKTEALTAAASLPPYKDLPRFFVLNCDKPNSNEMTWLRQIDDYLSLGKVNELGNATEIGIRAGLLYIVGWWHLFFCHANNLPDVEEIQEIRKNLDIKKGFIQSDKIWGVSKEHVLLFGLSKVLGSGIGQVEESNINFELSMVKALKGDPVDLNIFTSAFLENVPASGMSIQGELHLNQIGSEFVSSMTKLYPTINDNPGVIFISSEISEQGLSHILSNLQGQSMVAIVSDNIIDMPFQDVCSFNCDNKFFLKLYTKQGSK